MKADIHPNYRYVVFQDTSSGDRILTRSTIASNETVVWDDGNEYPLAKVEISAFTHPFFTGTMKIIDTAGRLHVDEGLLHRVRRSRRAQALQRCHRPACHATDRNAARPRGDAIDQRVFIGSDEVTKGAGAGDQLELLLEGQGARVEPAKLEIAVPPEGAHITRNTGVGAGAAGDRKQP